MFCVHCEWFWSTKGNVNVLCWWPLMTNDTISDIFNQSLANQVCFGRRKNIWDRFRCKIQNR
jgi:hypothetical protein